MSLNFDRLNGIAETGKPAERPKKAPKQDALPADIKRIYRAVYDYHARHSQVEDTADYWRSTNEDIIAVYEELGESLLALNMLKAVHEELVRQWEAIRKNPAQ